MEWHHVQSINWRDDGVEPWKELVVLEKAGRLFGDLRGVEGKIEV